MVEIRLGVKGMTCKMCVNHVREALQDLAGVEQADVDLTKKEAVIAYDEKKTTPEQIRTAVKEVGYELS